MTGINCQIAEIRDTVVVLTVEQPRGAVESAQADFQTTFRRLLDEGYAKFAIDISHALALDQALIGELVWAYTMVSRFSCALALVDTTARVEGILRDTRLDTVFRAFNNIEVAIRCLGDLDPPMSAVPRRVPPKPRPGRLVRNLILDRSPVYFVNGKRKKKLTKPVVDARLRPARRRSLRHYTRAESSANTRQVPSVPPVPPVPVSHRRNADKPKAAPDVPDLSRYDPPDSHVAQGQRPRHHRQLR